MTVGAASEGEPTADAPATSCARLERGPERRRIGEARAVIRPTRCGAPEKVRGLGCLARGARRERGAHYVRIFAAFIGRHELGERGAPRLFEGCSVGGGPDDLHRHLRRLFGGGASVGAPTDQREAAAEQE